MKLVAATGFALSLLTSPAHAQTTVTDTVLDYTGGTIEFFEPVSKIDLVGHEIERITPSGQSETVRFDLQSCPQPGTRRMIRAEPRTTGLDVFTALSSCFDESLMPGAAQ